MDSLEQDVRRITSTLVSKQKELDSVLALSREVVRDAAESITLIHNGKVVQARRRIAASGKKVGALKGAKDYGYIAVQALQEYAEARIMLGIKTTGKIPSVKEIGVPFDSYILGLLDTVGELKREVIDALRENNVSAAERYLVNMKRIYDSTRSMRFAEAVIRGFRKKQDTARIQIESAASELLRFAK